MKNVIMIFYVLFYNAASISDYKLLNKRMIVK
jgi:hypothetical protein